jgi:hypothetical protein
MPTYQNILSSSEKRLDITVYCQDILSEGEKEVFITIKKMTKTLKRKLQILATEKISNASGKALSKIIEDNGLTLAEIDSFRNKTLNDPEKEKLILKSFLNADINFEEKKKLDDYQNEVEKITFKECVCSKKHNFTDLKGELIDISDYNFWDKLGKDFLVLFIINEIEIFSEDFFLTRNGDVASGGPLET